jgi:hypothetical protein
MPAQRQEMHDAMDRHRSQRCSFAPGSESNSRASIELTHLKSTDYDFSAKDHKRIGRKNLSA